MTAVYENEQQIITRHIVIYCVLLLLLNRQQSVDRASVTRVKRIFTFYTRG